MDQSFLIALAILWFLFYWILGGAFFSIMAVLRIRRVRKARFGCLFTLVSAGTGVLVAWSGIRLAAPAFASCVLTSNFPGEAGSGSAGQPTISRMIDTFVCGLIPILGAFLVGFVILLAAGFFLLIISRSSSPSWLESSTKSEDQE